MTSKRVFFVMLASVMLAAITIVGSVVLGDQLLQKQSSKLTDLKVQNTVIDSQQAALAKAKKDIVAYTSLNNIAKQIVPQDKDQARAVREIISIANDAGIGISSVTFPASTLGQAQPATTPDASGSPAQAAPSLTQVKPVEGIKGVYQLEITVNTDTKNPIRYVQLIDFLGRLEQNRRTAQITNLTIQPSPLDRTFLTFSLQLTTYIKP